MEKAELKQFIIEVIAESLAEDSVVTQALDALAHARSQGAKEKFLLMSPEERETEWEEIVKEYRDPKKTNLDPDNPQAITAITAKAEDFPATAIQEAG